MKAYIIGPLMALTSGTQLGLYEIVAPLGAGGMGEVYRGLDARLDRPVAIKILTAHHSDDASRRQRFEREAKTVSSLNHPNICTLYDIGRQGGIDFIVVEFMEGVTLAERLEKGPLPTAEVLEYGIQLSSALGTVPTIAPSRVTGWACAPASVCVAPIIPAPSGDAASARPKSSSVGAGFHQHDVFERATNQDKRCSMLCDHNALE
jgi:hypothetical protein